MMRSWTLTVRCWKVAIVAAAVALAGACSKPAAEETESEAPVPVKVTAATTGTIRAVVHATGIVNPAPDGELIVIAPDAARIIDIPRAEGDRVNKGDVLVRFEIPTLTADVQRQAAEVQRAQASLAAARANQRRQRDLFDRGIAARKDVEEAERQVADAEAAVGQADASRGAATTAAGRSTVRAAFSGVIAKRFHNPGDLVEASASDPVLRVIDPRRLEIVASVPLSESPRVSIGAPARLAAGAAGARDLALKVVSRPAQVDQGTATIPVRLAFATPPANFSVGLPVQVDIDAEQHDDVVLIPSAALVREGEETAVFVAKGDKAERRPVMIGISDEQHVEIRSGVKAGEMVIIEGQNGLPDGATITTEAGEGGAAKGAKEDDEK